MFLLVIALLLSIFEFYNVDRELMSHQSWGPILGAGLPWIFSILLTVAALIFLLVVAIRLER